MSLFEIYLIVAAATFCITAFLDPHPRKYGLSCDIFAYTVVGFLWPIVWPLQLIQLLVLFLQWLGGFLRGK